QEVIMRRAGWRPRDARGPRPEGRRQASREVDLLVGRLCRHDDADALSPVLGNQRPKPFPRRRQRSVPPGHFEPVRLTHERRKQATLTLEALTRQAPLVAHPVLVHGRVRPGLEPEDTPFAMVDLDVAAVRTACTDGRRALEVPDPRAEP